MSSPSGRSTSNIGPQIGQTGQTENKVKLKVPFQQITYMFIYIYTFSSNSNDSDSYPNKDSNNSSHSSNSNKHTLTPSMAFLGVCAILGALGPYLSLCWPTSISTLVWLVPT